MSFTSTTNKVGERGILSNLSSFALLSALSSSGIPQPRACDLRRKTIVHPDLFDLKLIFIDILV